ncbi:MAG: YqaA family protein [Butyricimonas faecalis]
MDTLVSLGYWGLFIGSFLASTIIPMSADVLLVGVLALGGNVWGCLAIATVGNWLGGLTSYWIGWLGRWDWIERWFKVKREKLEQQKEHVDRYGVWLALFTWLPVVGDCLPLPSGSIVSVRECLLSICSWGVLPAFWCGCCCTSSTPIVLSNGSVDQVVGYQLPLEPPPPNEPPRIRRMTRHRC